MLCPIVHRSKLGGMDKLAQVLDRVRLDGTLLFHFELGHPWHLEFPARPYALFHYVSQGSATLALGQEQEIQMAEGDFVTVHGRYLNTGLPANWIVADIVRIENGLLAEHWDVIQDEATREQSKSGNPMFGRDFPK